MGHTNHHTKDITTITNKISTISITKETKEDIIIEINYEFVLICFI